ncbi:MAG: sulfotransferase [Caldilineaceae bacterium]|nr:sulfotransferase [Caldilineaceae bacterium]
MLKVGLDKAIGKARAVRSRTHPYLRNLALDLGVSAGSSTYTRFIVLGRSRVGSNFLVSLLNSHSRIKALGELLRDPANRTLDIPPSLQSISLLVSTPTNPVRFLQRAVFRTYPKHIAAVGFKVFYYHAQGEQWKSVWPYLREQQAIKVIHLKRRNILKTHLSRQRAALSDTWVNTNGSSEGRGAIELSYDECVAAFTTTRAWEEQYDCFFADHPKLELFYEQLAEDWAGEMGRVQEFLGVEPERLTPTTYKQSTQPLAQAIANYGELKARFQSTPWATFFEE